MSAVLDHHSEATTAVRAVLHYTRRSGQRPRNYTYEPPPGVPRNSGEVDEREVIIQDGRRVTDLGLDRSGFELLAHRSALRDWSEFQDAARVQARYYPEVQAALLAHTGADKVLVFDHTLRDSDAATGRAALREPVRRVHDDQTFESAPQRVHKHLDAAEAAQRLQRRFAIVNFWRPIGAPVGRAPLAAGRLRRAQHRGRGPDRQRPGLPRLDRRDLCLRLEPAAPLVLVSAADARRGDAAEGLRLGHRRHRAPERAYRLRPARRRRAGTATPQHRGAHAGVLVTVARSCAWGVDNQFLAPRCCGGSSEC